MRNLMIPIIYKQVKKERREEQINELSLDHDVFWALYPPPCNYCLLAATWAAPGCTYIYHSMLRQFDRLKVIRHHKFEYFLAPVIIWYIHISTYVAAHKLERKLPCCPLVSSCSMRGACCRARSSACGRRTCRSSGGRSAPSSPRGARPRPP